MKTLRFFLSLTFIISVVVMYSITPVSAAEGDLVWARGFGQNLDDIGYDIFVDAAGNVYTTGYFQGIVDFDPGTGFEYLTSAGNNDIFITKLNSSGNLVWARAFGSSFDDVGLGIFVDPSGNVYTTGYYQGTVNFDPAGAGTAERTSIGSADIFISKLNSTGDFVGAWTMGGTADDYGFGIFVDPSGNIYTTGYFRNTVDFDPSGGSFPLISEGNEDIFISKLNSDGSFGWARSIGGGTADVGLGISLYSSGNIYITGYFQGTVIYNPGSGVTGLTSVGSYDIFVLKLDSSGTLAWAKRMGGVSDDRGQAVSVDASGNVYTTGWFNGTADFDPSDVSTFYLVSSGGASDADIFVSKLNSSGSFVWAKRMGGAPSADVGYGIFADASGNVYTTGVFSGTSDFDPGGATTYNLVSAGGADIFISKLDSSGSFVWAKRMGDVSDDYGYDIFVDASGAVYTTGYFQGTADFDPGSGTHNLTSAGSFDIFVSKLAGRDRTFPWPMFLPAIIN
jgi:hypothetical protein